MTTAKTTIETRTDSNGDEMIVARYWDVYAQAWTEMPAEAVSDRILATPTAPSSAPPATC